MEKPTSLIETLADCAFQLELTTQLIRDATDGQSWLDIAGACEKQASIARRELDKLTHGVTP